jgi:hypothetical protein
MRPLVVRAAEIVTFGVIPLVALVFALWTYSDQGRLALDFHYELYPQAQLVRDGEHAFDTPEAYLNDRANLIWPIAAVLPVVPLTVVGPDAADWIATGFVLATLVAALLVLGVRDWRIYGLTLLWPSVIDAYQTANASLPLVLLVAVAWRWRHRAVLAGGAIGLAVAVKFFLWPLIVWLLATRRILAAIVAGAVAAGSVLLMVPFTDIGEYVRLLQKLRRTFEPDSYTLFALLSDLGAPETIARVATMAAGLGVLALAWRRRSLTLAIAAALVLSPIAWRHFFVLLIVPLAIARPRLDVLWLLPLGMWIGDGTFNGAPWQTAGVLAIAAATIVACETAPRRPELEARHSREPASLPI